MHDDPLTRRAAAAGLRVRSELVTITYEGRQIPSRPDDTVAAALVEAGELTCRRTDAGEPRGVFCGMGVCHDCLVRIDGVHGLRACLTPVRGGMQVGVDEPSPAPRPVDPVEESEAAPELLVAGGGPGGLAAAAAAAEAGADVLLVDERRKLGGQYFKQPSGAFEVDESRIDRQYREGRELIRRVERAGVRVLPGIQIWAAEGPHALYAIGEDTSYVLRPQRLVVATGAYERGVPMPGWTLPGFMTTGAAQTLMRASQVLPGSRVLVSGNGPLNVQVAAELVRAGATVVALCEAAPVTRPARSVSALRMLAAAPRLFGEGLGYLRTLRAARVPMLVRHAIVAAEGDGRVERAVVARLDRAGRAVPASERTFEVDAVCVGFGFLPSNELSRALGVEHVFDPGLGQLVAVRDPEARTSVESVWVVGDAAGTGGARLAGAVGFLAGLDAARSLGHVPSKRLEDEARAAERARGRHLRFQRALASLYRAPPLTDQLATPETLVCRCESVSLAAIEEALDGGIRELGAVKRATRAGMGRCQGRYCSTVLAGLTSRRLGRPLDPFQWFAPAPPFKPLPVRLAAAAEAPPPGP